MLLLPQLVVVCLFIAAIILQLRLLIDDLELYVLEGEVYGPDDAVLVVLLVLLLLLEYVDIPADVRPVLVLLLLLLLLLLLCL